MQGDMNLARERSEAALIVAREMGHARLECIVLCNLGLVDEAAGRPDQAQRHFESAIGLARQLGDRRSEGQFLTYLGRLHARQRRFGQAHACLDAGGALLSVASDRLGLWILLCAQAEAHHLSGTTDAARAALRAAEELAAEVDAGPGSEFGAALANIQGLIGPLSGG
jgi:tetratricopeptide (TPR) repeat protein